MNSTGLRPMRSDRRLSIKLAVVTIWLAFTLALAGWWLTYGLHQLDHLKEMSVAGAEQRQQVALSLDRQYVMLFSEGVALILLLLGGGTALLYSLRIESRRIRQVEEFFASFAHDLKTSLSSLRVQTESLQEELESDSSQGGVQRKLLDRIMGDAGRLETQLENALYLAEADIGGSSGRSLLLEPIEVGSLIRSLKHLWPKVQIQVEGDATVIADRRALESVVRNVIQNSLRHGQASEINIACENKGDRGLVRFIDNGRGFSGDRSRLGEIFSRQTATSGSGLGLYLIAKLVEKQHGRARILDRSVGNQGFGIEIELPLRQNRGAK